MKCVRLVTFLLVSSLILHGCSDEQPTPEVTVNGGKVLIANQGNFGWGEGTLSAYNPASKEIQNDVFKSKNNEALGNVFQSITKIDNRYFMVMNNSGKVVVTDTNFVKTGEITGLISPRYIYEVAEGKAYLTDIYADVISVVDLNTLTVTSTITTNGWSERGVVVDGLFWFAAPETDKVFRIDISRDKMYDSIQVTYAPIDLVIDQNETVWVACQGDETKDVKPIISRIDKTLTSVQDVAVQINGTPSKLVFHPQNNSVLYLGDGVWEIEDLGFTQSQLLPQSDEVFYTMGVDPRNGDVYVADVVDYVSRSRITRLDGQGALLDEFWAGIIAGDFFFP
ncbi:hypothetical protein N9J07_02610 [Bacteroidia bacterium]|nr:hypothetical protein [Bacteroidia bacterium]